MVIGFPLPFESRSGRMENAIRRGWHPPKGGRVFPVSRYLPDTAHSNTG
jgi:hypothetical protein